MAKQVVYFKGLTVDTGTQVLCLLVLLPNLLNHLKVFVNALLGAFPLRQKQKPKKKRQKKDVYQQTKKKTKQEKKQIKRLFFFSHLGSLERVALKIIHASIKTPGGQVVEEHDKIFHLFLLQQRQEFLYKYGRTIKSKSRRVSVRQSNVWAWVAGTPHDIG